MTVFRPETLGIAFLAAALLALTGCGGVVIGGAATVGVAVAQERTIGDAVDDATIRFQIKDRLLDESDTLFGAVGVESVEGRVLLSGNVRTPDDRVEVARITWQVHGVREVYNEIEIRERGTIADYLKDVGISNQLRFKMLTDQDISAINYTLETVNGVIYLMGVAQSQTELDRVTGHARTINGVQRVVSYVVIKDDTSRR
jgi:osmotically-inducible protein OsmY